MIVGTGYALREKIEKTDDFSLIHACREGEDVSVLLKVLRAERATRAEVARFEHQCERIAQLASPGLVALRGVEEIAGALIVVLEDFPGRDLARILAARPSRRMPVSEAPDLAAALAEGLAAVHAAGLVHRDLRPLTDLDRCREVLRCTRTIEPFVAGQRDRQDLFRIHQKLYGREQDIEALTAAFERALEGSREIVLVSGYSGIGKTSLVQEILKPLARQNGYFTSGKYDQYNRDTPYSAEIQALDGLVRQILTESEARILRRRRAILEALGPNAQVVCDVIPSLSHVVGAQPPVPALDPLEAQKRLNRCFLLFVSVFARAAHPLVLFLDDLQWIDPASLGLLRTLVADDSLEALFFCGAYRDNEVSPGHPFVRAMAVMDLIMPVMGGLEAIHCIRRNRQARGLARLPFIVVSASANEEDQAAAELVVPPREEMEVLHALALQGNMRDIRKRAAYLTTLDERYRPFADRLHRLAQGCQSKAIRRLIQEHMQGVEPKARLGLEPRRMGDDQRS